jgi:hypothetical protein
MIPCCGRWRRDLLAALGGVLVASAVLVPVGWSHVRAERQRAEAAEAELEVTRQQLAEEHEKAGQARKGIDRQIETANQLLYASQVQAAVAEFERSRALTAP